LGSEVQHVLDEGSDVFRGRNDLQMRFNKYDILSIRKMSIAESVEREAA
jgi:hypothetical protein